MDIRLKTRPTLEGLRRYTELSKWQLEKQKGQEEIVMKAESEWRWKLLPRKKERRWSVSKIIEGRRKKRPGPWAAHLGLE